MVKIIGVTAPIKARPQDLVKMAQTALVNNGDQKGISIIIPTIGHI